MSKVDDLYIKYKNSVSKDIFNSFVESDPTLTKKYLDYMCKMWSNRNQNGLTRSTEIIKLVLIFDSVINYLVNKDIYSPEYTNINILTTRLDDAILKKQEKEFNREKHGQFLHEDSNFLLVRPLTLEGSNKWGANTKWCTASDKGNQFNEYTRRGVLIYLIDKTGKRLSPLNKIGLYIPFNKNSSFIDAVEMWDAVDKRTTGDKIMKAGWTIPEFFNIISRVRYFAFEIENVQKAKDYLTDVNNLLQTIDIETLSSSIDVVTNTKNEWDNLIVSMDAKLKYITETLKATL